MPTNPGHFIEQVNHEGRCNMLSMIAHYDTEVKSIIIE